MIFPPVRIPEGGDVDYDWYVDGGTMMLVPIEAAINAGATIVYAICSTSYLKPSSQPASDFNPDSKAGSGVFLLDLAARVAMGMEDGEIAMRNLFPREGWGLPVVVIQPEYEDPYVDGFAVDPGLINIRMDHGYMRADDTVQAYEHNLHQPIEPIPRRASPESYSKERFTTAIIQKRFLIWRMEMDALGWNFTKGKPIPPTPHTITPMTPVANRMGPIIRHKAELKDLVEKRLASGGKCPPGHEKWWSDWEKHPHTIPLPPWSGKIMELVSFPHTVKLGISTSITITVKDLFTSNPITNASVLDGESPIGPVGKPFPHIFKATTGEGGPKHPPSKELPEVTVRAPGYPDIGVPINFV
jgi:hypothetical protein